MINRLLMACGLRHFEASHRPEAPECWHPVDLKSVEPV